MSWNNWTAFNDRFVSWEEGRLLCFRPQKWPTWPTRVWWWPLPLPRPLTQPHDTQVACQSRGSFCRNAHLMAWSIVIGVLNWWSSSKFVPGGLSQHTPPSSSRPLYSFCLILHLSVSKQPTFLHCDSAFQPHLEAFISKQACKFAELKKKMAKRAILAQGLIKKKIKKNSKLNIRQVKNNFAWWGHHFAWRGPVSLYQVVSWRCCAYVYCCYFCSKAILLNLSGCPVKTGLMEIFTTPQQWVFVLASNQCQLLSV